MIKKDILNKITVILPLYKTPHNLIKQFNQYKDLKLIILDQSNDQELKKKTLEQNPNILKYITLDKNIGFAKACNLLLKNVKTKYCLLTQADMKISLKSIYQMLIALNKIKNCIISAPNLSRNIKKKKLTLVNNVIGANFLFDVKKMNKFKFFDENFFLYWEDVDLCYRIKKTKYKMIIVNNAVAKHFSSKSSTNNMHTFFIRNINFKFGEYLFYKKIGKLKKYKALRQIITNFIYFLINLIKLNLLNSLKNISYIIGIFKFLAK